jgi:hypothetical protein
MKQIIILSVFIISCHPHYATQSFVANEDSNIISQDTISASDIKSLFNETKNTLITGNFKLADSIPEYNPFKFPLQSISAENVFTKKDLVSIQQQLNQQSFFQWNNDLIPGVQIIRVPSDKYILQAEHTSEYKKLYATFMNENYVRMGIPAFSIDKKNCCIYLEYNNGVRSDQGELFIFQKDKKNTWNLYKKTVLWTI